MKQKQIEKVLELINSGRGVCNSIAHTYRFYKAYSYRHLLADLYKDDPGNPYKGTRFFLGSECFPSVTGKKVDYFIENQELRATAFLLMLAFIGEL